MSSPATSGVTVSKDGIVTGNTYDKYGSTNPVVDVFGADGKFAGTVKPAEYLRSMVVRGNRMVGLGETPDGS